MPIYTLNRCTIEVAKGGRSAKATRHETGEEREFVVIAEPDAPTPQVQAERWAKGKPIWPEAEEPTEIDPVDVAVHEATAVEVGEVNESTDG